jgi:hypothetical protein
MNDQQITLSPAAPQTMQREFNVMLIVAGVVLATCLFSVTSGMYESLRTAFPWWTAISIAFGIAVAFDLACAVLFFFVVNLFARGRMSKTVWNMYLASAIGLAVVVLFIGNMVIENVHAVAAKTRGFKFAVDYSSDPLLLNAKQNKREIDSTLRAIDAAMLDIGKSMRTAGTAAEKFSKNASDTSFGKKQRANQLWGAMKANNTQSNLGQQLMRLNEQRGKILTAKLNASARVDSLLFLLKSDNSFKSPEDIIEARLGIDFLKNISLAEVFIMGLAVFVIGFIPIIRQGQAFFFNVEYKPAHALAPATISSSETEIVNQPVPLAVFPEPLCQPFRDGDIDAACAWVQFMLFSRQYRGNHTGGTFSETLRRVGGRKHTLHFGRLQRAVRAAKDFMKEKTAEEVQARLNELIEKHGWQKYSVC